MPVNSFLARWGWYFEVSVLPVWLVPITTIQFSRALRDPISSFTFGSPFSSMVKALGYCMVCERSSWESGVKSCGQLLSRVRSKKDNNMTPWGLPFTVLLSEQLTIHRLRPLLVNPGATDYKCTVNYPLCLVVWFSYCYFYKSNFKPGKCLM